MINQIVNYKASFIQFEITTVDGGSPTTDTITFDNDQIRGDVEFKSGKHTELFISPNGATSSQAIQGGKEFRFTLRAFENPAARLGWQQLLELTQKRYSATFTLNYFQSIFTGFPETGGQGDEVKTIAAVLSNAVIEIKDHYADATARGHAPRYPREIEVIVREGSGLTLIQLPASEIACGEQTPCGGPVNFSASGSVRADGSSVTTSSTGVLMEWRFGSFATARIAPGDDATNATNWAFVSGSFGATNFERRIVDKIEAGGNGLTFDLNVLPLAYYSGVSSLTIGVTVVDGADTSSESSCPFALDDYDELFTITQAVPAASHQLDLVLRWWSVCQALYIFADDSEEKDTTLILTNNQHTFGSSGTKVTRVKSNVDVREIICPREYINFFDPIQTPNLEVLALSEQFTPSSGGYYRETYSNADDNNLSSLDVSGLSNLRELYAIGCGLTAGNLTLGSHPNLNTVSIDHQSVLNSSLLSDLNSITSIKKLRVGNHASSGAISNPSFTQPNLEELSAPFANLSGAITISNTQIKVIRVDDNPLLTSFTASSFPNLEILSLLNTPVLSGFLNNPYLKELGLPPSYPAFTFVAVPLVEKVEVENNSSLSILDLQPLTLLDYFRAKNCSSFTTTTLYTGAGFTMSHFEVTNCNWDYANPNNYFTRTPTLSRVNDCTIILTYNGLTVSEINKILVDIDTDAISGFTGRSIDLSNNSAPDSSSGGYNGTAAKASLITKGFNVITD